MGTTQPPHVEDLFEAIERLAPEPASEHLEPTAPERPQTFDSQSFLDRMLGDVELAKEMAGLFLGYSPELMTTLRQALTRHDAKSLTDAAQALKGSAANIGLHSILEIAGELEQLGHDNKLKEAEDLYDRLENEMATVQKALGSISGRDQPWRMLIADDDPVSRRMLQATLMKWGHNPTVCSDGTQALQHLREQDGPGVAILDWMMPGLQGVEVCRELRKQVKNESIYVILLTGKDKTEDIIEALDAGADDYMVKPFNPTELKARIREGFRTLNVKASSSAEELDLDSEAARDSSTGILGREAILVVLKRELAACESQGTPVAAVLVEVDSYDILVNDYGAEVANLALKQLIEGIKPSMAAGDHVGRYDDRRLLVVLGHCDKQKAQRFVEEIRSRLESTTVVTEGATIPVTACFGGTWASQKIPTNMEHLIQAAESALNQAERRGSNNAVFVMPSSSAPGEVPEDRPRRIPSRLELELIVASRAGDLKRVRQLLKSGADVNATDNKGNSPLLEASFFKYPELVDLLLDNGADIALENSMGDTALTEAVRAGHIEVVERLLARISKPGLNTALPALYKALLECSAYGKTEVVTVVKTHLSRLRKAPAPGAQV
jgi:diguanylate cyclase (GGDEF)-like protein